MNFALAEMPLPLRFRPATPMSDEELMRFCAANDAVRVERDANGEILVMTPAGSMTSSMNSRITRLLDEWAEEDGRGIAFDSNGGFTLPDGAMRAADAAWVERRKWDALKAEEQARFAPLCPDFVIELRSPGDSLPELRTKMQQWIANGARLAHRPPRTGGLHLSPRRRARGAHPPHFGTGNRRHGRLRAGDGSHLVVNRRAIPLLQ